MEEKFKRKGRGSRMSKLVNSEHLEKLEQTFGHMAEEDLGENEDKEFDVEADQDAHYEDFVDEDFDIDENGEAVVDEEAALFKTPEERPKKKSVYVDPKKRHNKKRVEKVAAKKSGGEKKSLGSESARKERREKKEEKKRRLTSPPKLRRSTVASSKEASRRAKIERNEKKLRKEYSKRRKVEKVEMSQSERLREAKVTEQINLASLKDILKLELERKKKARQTAPKIDLNRPSVTLISSQRPLHEVLPIKEQLRRLSQFGEEREEKGRKEEKKKEKQSDSKPPNNALIFYPTYVGTPYDSQKRIQCKTPLNFSFLSFTTKHFLFRGKDPKKETCVITGLPAKYIDPLTNKPYATIEAFKEIRKQVTIK